MLVTYLEVDPTEAANEVGGTRGYHSRFKLLEELYKHHMRWAEKADGNGVQVEHH